MNSLEIIAGISNYSATKKENVVFSPAGTIMAGTVSLSPGAAAMHLGLPTEDEAPKGITMNEPGYESLAQVLARAFDQAANGKGRERHANALPFEKQPMQVIAGQVGPAFLTGQAIKKIQESQGLAAGRDTHELLGAINYLAGCVIFLESQRHAANDPKAEA